MQRHLIRSLALLALLPACAGTKRAGDVPEPLATQAEEAVVAEVDPTPGTTPVVPSTQDPEGGEQEWQPLVPKDDGADWLQLKSGEWIRGRLTVLDHRDLEFDSDELDDLELEWADVKELRSPRLNSILLGDGTVIYGTIHVRGDDVLIGTGMGMRTITREDLIRIAPGGKGDRSQLWSGRLSLSASARSGNTSETDASTSIFVRRRSAKARTTFDYRADFSRVQDITTSSKQRFNASHDYFPGKRFFLTLAALDFFREPLENIDRRLTPSVGIGYTVIDSRRTLWDFSLAGGYQVTEFVSVEAGADSRDETTVLILGTAIDSDLTKWLEFVASYSAQLSLEDIENSNQNASARLSFDLVKDFDVDFTLTWDRQGNTVADANGDVADPYTFRLTIGIGWEF